MKSLILLLSLLVLISVPAWAMGVDVVGGYIYTKMAPDEANQLVDQFNDTIDDKIVSGFEDFVVERNLMEDIDSAHGYYFGFATDFNNKKVTAKYEKFYIREKGNVILEDVYGDEGTYFQYFGKVDMDLNGLCIDVAPPLNEYISINGGFGYYHGDGLAKIMFKEVQPGSHDEASLEGIYDLYIEDTLGYTVGISLNYETNNGLRWISALNYRSLIVDVEPTFEIGQTGNPCPLITDNAPQELEPFEADLSGLEFSLGVSRNF